MLRLLVLTAVVAAAAAQYPAYAGWNGAGYASAGYSGYSGYSGYAAPLGYAAAPMAYAAAPAPYSYSRRYRTQDELGQATYGHEEATQNQAAVRDAAGNVAGSYNYINPDGKLITVKYTAGVNGFQVESNALPIAPIDTNVAPIDTGVAPVYTGVAPTPVDFTPEVKAATAEHLAAVEEAKAADGMEQERKKRSPLLYAGAPVIAPAAGYAAEKTEVILNPGHATAYRIEPVGVAQYAAPAPGLYAAHAPGLYAAPALAQYAAHAPGLYAAHAPGLYAAPAPGLYAATAPAAAGYAAEKTEVILNPGHATAYRIDAI